MLASPRTRRSLTALAVLGLTLSACAKEEEGSKTDPAIAQAAAQQVARTEGELCKMKAYGMKKQDLSKITVGFAQSEKENNPFRTAETQSIKDEAAKRGIKLITSGADGDLNKEISDIKDMIQKGAKALIVSPLKSEGLDPALTEAKEKGIPVFTIDRLLTTKKHCVDYLGWVGSDFVDQGKKAAEAMLKATGKKGVGVTLLGAAGVNVTDDRNKGYREVIDKCACEFKVVAEQTGDFDRAKGQAVTEQLLQKHKDLTAIYAHNDEMALGAKAALEAAGKKAGDVKIVTIDGTRNAVQGVVDGWIQGVIESNPRFGPLAFKTLDDFTRGEEVPQNVIIQDGAYDADNARQDIGKAY